MTEPAHDRIAVLPDIPLAMSTGEHVNPDIEGEQVALHIPEGAQEKPNTGLVTGVGPDVTSCLKGDKVHYGKYTGDPIEMEDNVLLFIRDADVIAVEKGDAWTEHETVLTDAKSRHRDPLDRPVGPRMQPIL